MGIAGRHYQIKSRFEATIEKRDCIREGQMSLKRELFLWKTFIRGLAVGPRMLAERDVCGFGEAKSEPTAFFETNRRQGFVWRNAAVLNPALLSDTLRHKGIARIPAHEQAGGLNGQVRARELDRIQRQPNVAAAIVPDIGGASGLYPA